MKLDSRHLAVFLSCLIGGFCGLGILVHTHPEVVLKLFDLDKERNLPTLFSAGLLLGNAAMLYQLIRRGVLGAAYWPLAILFAEMAFDESLRIHENVEDWIGVDWQIAYLPLIGAAGIGWLAFLRRHWNDVAVRSLWLVGATAWIASQLSEAAAWGWWGLLPNQEAQGYLAYVVVEETLEMTGSALFLLALLCRLQTPSSHAENMVGQASIAGGKFASGEESGRRGRLPHGRPLRNDVPSAGHLL
jgi:hypothetical protein